MSKKLVPTIRVVGGEHRGRKIKQPPKSITRPTMDRVKEAMFNVIQFKIRGSICLDLFAGSGSLSIEAVSRGAMKSVAIDKSNDAINVINENLETIGINNVQVVKRDVVDYVRSAKGLKFDYIFHGSSI